MKNEFTQVDFGPILEYLQNDDITDISYSNGGQVWLKTLSRGVYRTENPAINNAFMEKMAFQCANSMGKSFNMANPFLDAESDELRMNFVHDSIAKNGIAVLIRKIIDFNINTVEILGVDPFCDNPEEYHPQYNNDYLLKIVAILRTILPDINIKYKYPTNGISIINELLKLGVNVISGVYTDNTNPNIYNIEEIQNILNKSKRD